jgi:flagellar biosynthesis/type III secretory pathway protein FliH
VHLNPEDLARCRRAQQENEQGGDLVGIKLVPDPNVGRAECVVESPKGIVKSLIDENLERIAKALRKAE